MKVRKIGEFSLIDIIRHKAGTRAGEVVVGIGDDAAVIDSPQADRQFLATIDMLVEGIHFDLSYTPANLLGRKSLAVSLSDIASMGGEPAFCLVSLGLRKDAEVEFVEQFYDGLLSMAGEYGCPLAGGDTVSSPHAMVVDVAVLGTVPAGQAFLRSAARPGQVVLVTGSLGNSAAGLQLLLKYGPTVEPAFNALVRAHLDPVPRLRESLAARRCGGVGAMMDISDGLANEINHIARESGVGAVIWAESLPVEAGMLKVASIFGVDPVDLALTGGEDYEIVFTADPRAADRLSRVIYEETGTKVTQVGEILPAGHDVRLVRGGESCPLKPTAFDHFRSSGATS